MEQPHLADAQHQVALRLGGLTRDWRFDRMATVVHPATGKVTATYSSIAKHFGVRVRLCPPRRGNRKGVVEKANHSVAQRWWRSLPDEVTTAQAQASWTGSANASPTNANASGRTGSVAPLLLSPPPSGSAQSRRALRSRSSR